MLATLPILTFHALDDQASVISFSPHLFQRGLAMLQASGYRTLSLLEAVSRVRQNEPFPDRSFVLTFDDGYQTVYTEAFPVLQRYGMTATVFVTVGEQGAGEPRGRLPTFEGRPMLSWPEIREMAQWGIDIGAHTLTHPDLTQLSADAITTELHAGQTVLEDALDRPVTCFAYPFGRYDSHSHEIAQRYFTCACADTLGLLTLHSDPYALERVDAYYLRTEYLFQLMVSRFFPWYIRACNIPRRLKRAVLRRTALV